MVVVLAFLSNFPPLLELSEAPLSPFLSPQTAEVASMPSCFFVSFFPKCQLLQMGQTPSASMTVTSCMTNRSEPAR